MAAGRNRGIDLGEAAETAGSDVLSLFCAGSTHRGIVPLVSGADSFTGGRNISCAGISGFGNRFCVAVTTSGTGIPTQAILLRCRLPDYFRAVTVSLFFVDSERFFLSAGSAYPEPSALLCAGGRFCIIVPAVTMYAFIPACAFGTAGAAVPGPVSFRCAAAGAAVPRPVSFRCAAS